VVFLAQRRPGASCGRQAAAYTTRSDTGRMCLGLSRVLPNVGIAQLNHRIGLGLPAALGCTHVPTREEVNDITRRQVKSITVWLGMATAAVVLLQALIQLVEMFMHH
jgi:hypothetical protein